MAAALCLIGAISVRAEQSPPNIIFVLADDLGWAELGCYGNDFHETPHLDRLAKEGMRFTQAYAAAPVCSPYRAAFLTGQAPARLGITDYLRPNSANGLPAELAILPEVLRDHGYSTGMVGKWHLTGYRHHGAEIESRPSDHGFDWNLGSEVKSVGNGANTFPYVFRDQPISWLDLEENRLGEEEYLTDRLNLEAVDFIERSVEDGKPFFLYLSHYAPHSILNGRRDLVEKYRRKHPPGKSGRENCYLCEDAARGKGDPGNHWAVDHNPHLAAMLESIDEGIGSIVAKLEDLGITENTILVFTSDNGGETNVTSNAPLRGGKSELYEGGIRVPLIVRWPAKVPPGRVSEMPTMNTDFFPTFLEVAGVRRGETPRDGISVLANWVDPEERPERDELAWHYPLDRPHFLGGVSAGAIRAGDWKMIQFFDSDRVELYHLGEDPSEERNRAQEEPGKVAELRDRLDTWRSEVGARHRSPPFLTETRELYFGDHFTPGMVSERLWYTRDWVAEAGVLKRLETGSKNTRIFLRDAEFEDAVIQFDFRLGNARDVRLMTGSGGGYNAVIHLRSDCFFIQTAIDRSIPYFPYHHGECAFDFDPDRWYSMTIEFLGDEVVAHLDREHVAHARHPMIDRTRQYLALQVDERAATFDNFQVFKAVPKKGDAAAAGRAHLEAMIDRFPVDRSDEEAFEIRRTNAHESYYQNDARYRALVDRVEELDERNRSRFPEVLGQTKDIKKAIQDERRRLNESDPEYKKALHATHRANRAIEAFLVSQRPEIDEWPRSRREAEVERLRRRYEAAEDYRSLVAVARDAQAQLEAAYPQLFVSDEAIKAKKKAAREQAKKDPDFNKALKERADAYRAQQNYLLENDEALGAFQAKQGE